MPPNLRRSAGTQTFADVLLDLLRIKPASAMQDLEDFTTGTTLKVTCLCRSLPGANTRVVARGHLYLTRGRPVTWQPARTGTTIQGPLKLSPSDTKTDHWKLTAFHMDTGSGPFIAIIPKTDVQMVKYALETEGS
jgi:hypothetical protein